MTATVHVMASDEVRKANAAEMVVLLHAETEKADAVVAEEKAVVAAKVGGLALRQVQS